MGYVHDLIEVYIPSCTLPSPISTNCWLMWLPWASNMGGQGRGRGNIMEHSVPACWNMVVHDKVPWKCFKKPGESHNIQEMHCETHFYQSFPLEWYLWKNKWEITTNVRSVYEPRTKLLLYIRMVLLTPCCFFCIRTENLFNME